MAFQNYGPSPALLLNGYSETAMHITHTAVDDLISALGRVIPAIPPKSTLFVLEHVLLDASGEQLELTATDTELVIVTRVPVHIGQEGKVLVPARKLYDVVRSLPDDISCELMTSSNKLVLKTAMGLYEFPTLNAEEFPELPHADYATSVTISADDAAMIANTVVYAASTEQYRPAMTGVKFEIGDSLVAVATDGYRLATLSLPIGNTGRLAIEAIVPARVVELLSKVSGDVTLGFSKTHVIIASEHEQIIARLIDESYPQWRNVLPSDNTKVATVERSGLLKAIRRVALFTSSTNQLVRFRFTIDTVTLSVLDVDTGARAEETVPCRYTDETIEIGFNNKYMAEALAHLPTDHVQLAFSTPSRAVLMTPVDQDTATITKLVMPMRLG